MISNIPSILSLLEEQLINYSAISPATYAITTQPMASNGDLRAESVFLEPVVERYCGEIFTIF